MTDITVTIDDKACVGCLLCVDVCPTKVFEASSDESKPEIREAKECFGCLSCTEICPATAISHTGHTISESYYHDRFALNLAAKIGRPPRTFLIPGEESKIDDAMRDLGVRLLSVASVLKQTLGQSLPSVGTMAGMSLAHQLPRYQPIGSLEEACNYVSRTLAPAWDCAFSVENDNLSITVKNCFVRTLCNREKLELGGDLCTLFYNYLAGYFSKISGKRPRLIKTVTGESSCSYSVKLYG